MPPNGLPDLNGPLPTAVQDDPSLADPVHLARIANRSGRHILAAAISRDGSRVAFSDAVSTRLLSVTGATSTVATNHVGCHLNGGGSGSGGGGGVSFRRQPLPDGLPSAHLLCFGAAASQLMAASADGTIAVVDLEAQRVVCRFPASARAPRDEAASGGGGGGQAARAALQPPLAALAVSPAGDMLAAAGPGAVHFFRFDPCVPRLCASPAMHALEAVQTHHPSLTWHEIWQYIFIPKRPCAHAACSLSFAFWSLQCLANAAT